MSDQQPSLRELNVKFHRLKQSIKDVIIDSIFNNNPSQPSDEDIIISSIKNVSKYVIDDELNYMYNKLYQKCDKPVWQFFKILFYEARLDACVLWKIVAEYVQKNETKMNHNEKQFWNELEESTQQRREYDKKHGFNAYKRPYSSSFSSSSSSSYHDERPSKVSKQYNLQSVAPSTPSSKESKTPVYLKGKNEMGNKVENKEVVKKIILKKQVSQESVQSNVLKEETKPIEEKQEEIHEDYNTNFEQDDFYVE
jgi:hypothetical protein